ncbi:hypothetical protein TNCV_3658691 [Trichonephila clavipes]|nr:hypothetical protein TNCV_3658691 [Trichonephila clavipes]
MKRQLLPKKSNVTMKKLFWGYLQWDETIRCRFFCGLSASIDGLDYGIRSRNKEEIFRWIEYCNLAHCTAKEEMCRVLRGKRGLYRGPP